MRSILAFTLIGIVAVARADEDLVAACLGGDADGRMEEPFYNSVWEGHMSCIDAILAHGKKQGNLDFVNAVNKEGHFPLYAAAYKGRVPVIKRLLANGAQVDKRHAGQYTALYVAIDNGFAAAAELLLKSGASPHGVGVANGDDTSRPESTPLFAAAHKGQAGVAELLLEYGAAPDRPRPDGTTPLMIAAQEGHYQMVRLLLLHGANPNNKGHGGATALHFAVDAHHVHTLHLLVDQRPSTIEPPSEEFAPKGPPKPMKRIRAAIETRDGNGRTPLQLAAMRGFDQCAQVLLENGASVLSRNDLDDNRNALDYATTYGHVEVLYRLLKAVGAGELTKQDRAAAVAFCSGMQWDDDVHAAFDSVMGSKEEL